MANKLFAATRRQGVYYTEDNCSTWTAINNGLPDLELSVFAVDAIAPDERQYVLLENTPDIYTRTTGNWSALLTDAQAETLVGESGQIYWVAANSTVAGHVLALFATAVSGTGGLYVIQSYDYGVNWEVKTVFEDTYIRTVGNVAARGVDDILVTTSVGVVARDMLLYYSDDGGDTWVATGNLGLSTPWTPYGRFSMFDTTSAYVQSGISVDGFDIAQVNLSTMAVTKLQAGQYLGPDRQSGQLFYTANRQNIVKTGDLYTTADNWATITASTSMTKVVEEMAIRYDNQDLVYLGVITLPAPHTVFTYTTGDADVTGASGPDPDNAPFTDSIPDTSNGICYNGLVYLNTDIVSVAISGEARPHVGDSETYIATVYPETAKTPITYTWSPTPDSGQGAATVSYSFDNIGCQQISVTATNSTSTATGTYTVCVCGQLRQIIYEHLQDKTEITSLVSTRCYPDRLPENVTYPALTFARVSADNGGYREHNANPTNREVSRVQFNCYASTGDGAATLADAVREVWDGYQDNCIVGYAFQTNRVATRADAINAYLAIVDVMIEHCTW